MGATIRRIRPSEGELLRAVRLAAPGDARWAFGANYAEAARLSEDAWIRRAREGAPGCGSATWLAHDEHDAVGTTPVPTTPMP